MTTLTLLASSLLIVASETTDAKPEWHEVVSALQAKHADAKVEVAIVKGGVTDSLEAIRKAKPRYLAFVMTGEELDAKSVKKLHEIVRNVDDDPFDDAIWGIVTGPTAAVAKRIASSKGPGEFRTALATTGLEMDVVSGEVMMLSDGNPAGSWKTKTADGKVENHSTDERDITAPFAAGWNADPQLILTSSHATERNLEMPFSRGNLLPSNGKFVVSCGAPLEEPKTEKVWIAAGNCLIANNRYGNENMLMTALGWGKVNQFFGYIVETWFGEIGWNTWRYFGTYRMPLNLSWYAANQNLVRMMAMDRPRTRERAGREWDMDGTAFYGDPMQAIQLATLDKLPEWTPNALPLLYVIEPGVERKPFPADWEVFEADDFALVTKWTN